MDYETDILTQTDWSGFDPSPVADALFSGGKQAQKIVRHIGLESDHLAAVLPELRLFDPVLAVRRISDIVLNPFVARDIVGKLISAFKAKGYDALSMGAIAADIVDTLNTALKDYQNAQAESYFKAAVMAGNIQFRLRVDGNNWQLPTYLVTTESTQAHQVLNQKGEFLSKNLFSVVYASDMNKSEQEVAVWLDGQDNLGWWHRNIARHHYRLQGWQKKAIYPDFVFSVLTDGQTKRLCVLEMKGDHLAGNERTEYIRNVLCFLTDNFTWDNTQPVGQLELENKGETVVCDLVLFDGWNTNLPEFFN